MNAAAIKTILSRGRAKAGFGKSWRFGALGTALGLLMGMPTTALGWNYSNVPLFWVQGIKPNVALMIDDSGSMKAMTTNEAFQRANVTNSVPSTTWYWCTAYNNAAANPRCTSTNGSVSSGFHVRVWDPDNLNSNSRTISRSWTANATGPGNCSSSSSGFFKTTTGTSTGTNYTASGICQNNHGYANGMKINYSSKPSTGSTNLSTSTQYYIVNSTTHGFQLATSPGGAPIPFTITLGSSGSWRFSVQNGLPSYVTDISTTSVALCNVTKKPGSADFYVGVAGNTWNGTPALPSEDEVGVLVSNRSGGSGTMDSCVRWKLSSTARSSNTNTPEGKDYTRYNTGTNYKMDSNIPYGNFLLNTLIGSKSSYNFDDSSVYPDQDTDDTKRDWDTSKDKTVASGGSTTDNKYFIIPNATRVQAAREASQKVVVDFFEQMNIGLFHLNTSPRLIVPIPNGSNPGAAKLELIGTTESMLPVDLPSSAVDGAIGNAGASGGTPLALTQTSINDYFKGELQDGTETCTGSGWNRTCVKNTHPSPIEYRCQKNYAVVMTDGEPSSDSGTLDAAAQTGYNTDIKTSGQDADGVSWDDGSNNNKWKIQNVVTYTIGLGLENNLLKRAPLVNRVNVTKSNISNNTIKLEDHGLQTGDYLEIVSGAPTSFTNGNFYYAAVVDKDHFKLAGTSRSGDSTSTSTNNKQKAFDCANGGSTSTSGPCLTVAGGSGTMVISTGPGKSFFSFTPEQLAQDLGSVFNSINNLTSSASSVSTNTKQFSGEAGEKALVYQAKFNTEDWSGEVVAYPIVQVNGKVTVDTSEGAPYEWSTKSTLRTAADRPSSKMYTWNRTEKTAKTLTWANLDAQQQASLGGAATGANVISWLQGNHVGGMRSHSSKGLLGDILNSDPIFLSYLNQNYDRLPTAGSTGADEYEAYVEASKSRTPMIYVGANDGMLHALDASTGKEKMTFLPAAIFRDWNDLNNNGIDDDGAANRENKLLNLTSPNYDHRYFVDGSLTVGDAYVGGSWKTYLVGGLGRGGRSVFAMDVTNPDSYSTSTIKWEFTDPDLGYSYGAPIIARLANNKWYAIFPNGLDSNGDKARVFMVNLADEDDVIKLEANTPNGQENGMMAVQVKLNSERTVTDIYAGDMLGNIWKFDVYNENGTPLDLTDDTANLSPSAVKLFTAASGQAITGGIRIGNHPDGLGSLIFFGTGKYFEVQDNIFNASSVPQVDSFYAVLDNGTSTGITQAQLQKQTFSMSGPNLRTSTQTVTSYTGAGSKMGWYIDLLNGANGKQGERVVSTPVLYGGRVIFTSIIPLSGGTCGGEGSSWLNELDALTGGMLDEKVLDTNNDGKLTDSDQKVSSMRLEGLASDPSVILGQKDDYKVIGSTSTTASVQTVAESKPKGLGGDDDGRKGRMSWKQLQ